MENKNIYLKKNILRSAVFSIMFISLLSANVKAQANNGADTSATAIKELLKKEKPKLWKTLEMITKDGVEISFNKDLKNPGRTLKTRIELNTGLMVGKVAAFPEDRLVIVALHEYGHVLYGRKVVANPTLNAGKTAFERSAENEYQAFRYSITQAIAMAKEGDKGPLNEVIKNLKQRGEKGRADDAHTVAIKRLMAEPFWQQAEKELKPRL